MANAGATKDIEGNHSKRNRLEPVAMSDATSASTVFRAYTKDLILAEPLDIVVAREGRFRIVHYYSDEYDKLDIMDVEKMHDEGFQLAEEISEVAEDASFQLKYFPDLKEIVLAPKEDGQYHRAVVVKISQEDQCVDLYFFDAGGMRNNLSVSKLKQVNKEIMKFPILGYQVILKDAPRNCYLFTTTEHDALLKKRVKMTFKLEIAEPLDSHGFFRYKNYVILNYMDGIQPISLASEINALKCWEWEKFSGGAPTDDDHICENGAYGKVARGETSNLPLATFSFKNGTEFSANVSRIVPDKKDATVADLCLVVLYEPLYKNYFNVLHHQMQRYCQIIKPSSFYPGLREPLMIKLENTEEYQRRVKFSGNWVRAIRYDDNMIYLLDFDDYVPFKALDPETFTMRRIYFEFFKLPLFAIHARVMENGKPMSVQKAKETFKIRSGKGGQRYEFKIVQWNEGRYDIEMQSKKRSRSEV